MRVLAFAASNSRHSINKSLVEHAGRVLRSEIVPDAEVELLDLNDFEMPIYSADREQADGIPDLARDFLGRIGAADAVLISYAEHNGLYTAAFKNIFDWVSRIQRNVFQDKPMVIMSASPGKRGGASVLKIANESVPRFGGDIRASFSVGPFSSMFDAEAGRLRDPELAETLRRSLNTLRDHAG